MKAAITWIEYYLPTDSLSNETLVAHFPNWTADKLLSKTGIANRHIADDGTCASDLAYFAATQLFDKEICSRDEIDFILFCTQGSDYSLPTSACILQDRLGLSTSCGALDFNLGCSGYVYGLGLVKGLIETGQAKKVLLLTADTYSKWMKPDNISVRSIFGDAGTATLICATESGQQDYISQPIFGTDGAGAKHLIVKKGGMRNYHRQDIESKDDSLYMNGPEIFNFTLMQVPQLVNQLLEKEKSTLTDFDLFVFHQANLFMLNHLRDKLDIDKRKFYIYLKDVGNTVSSSIPIALKNAYEDGVIKPGMRIMLIGFGVGLSWAGAVVSPIFANDYSQEERTI